MFLKVYFNHCIPRFIQNLKYGKRKYTIIIIVEKYIGNNREPGNNYPEE
jgi:hypothetical protein